MATKEELMAQGFDEATAELLSKAAGEPTSGGMPFPLLKFNYDQKDILIEKGIAKGSFIAGWKIDNKKLEIVEDGVVLEAPMSFYIVASMYQNTHYDTQTRSTDIQTDIFRSPYDSQKMIDKKSGKTIKQLKEEGKKVTFNNILLIMVDTPDGKKPYLHYMHGTHYHKWNEQLEELGVSDDKKVLFTNFTVEPLRVPTDFQPAWTMKVLKVEDRTPEEISKDIAVVSDAIKKFDSWVNSVNSGESVSTKNAEVGGTTPAPANVDIDVDEEEIPF